MQLHIQVVMIMLLEKIWILSRFLRRMDTVERKLHENINWVEYLKLRASIGLVGNNQNENGRYLFDQTYSSNGSYF